MTNAGKRRSLASLGSIALAAALAVGAFTTTAQARWGDDNDYNHYQRYDNDGDHDRDRHDGYHRYYGSPPPVVYYGRGYGYYPPPVVYAPPGIGIYVPGIGIEIH